MFLRATTIEEDRTNCSFFKGGNGNWNNLPKDVWPTMSPSVADVVFNIGGILPPQKRFEIRGEGDTRFDNRDVLRQLD